MAFVVDASVALKWVFKEEGREQAVALIGSEPLLAPEFLWLECANVLAMKENSGKIPATAAEFSLARLQAVPIRLFPTLPLLLEAQHLSVAVRRTTYDCLYLALAQAEGATVITADRRFADAVNAHPVHAGRVQVL